MASEFEDADATNDVATIGGMAEGATVATVEETPVDIAEDALADNVVVQVLQAASEDIVGPSELAQVMSKNLGSLHLDCKILAWLRVFRSKSLVGWDILQA